MKFELSAEQKMLKKSAKEFFSREVDGALVREIESDENGHHLKTWKKMAQLGWQGLIIPEAYGGEGMKFSDLTVVLEEMGTSALPGPFFISSIASALILIEAADEDQKKNLLPELASGKKIFIVAWNEENSGVAPADISMKALRINDQYKIFGKKRFVPYAHISDYIIFAARTGEPNENGDEGITLFYADKKTAGITINLISNSTGEKFCEVDFENVMIPMKNQIGELNKGWRVLAPVFLKCAVAESAKMVGAGEKVMKMVVDYAKKRVQFGRPIGSFQAIQHHCADMKTFLDTSLLLVRQASWRISDCEEWEREAAMCKAWTGESIRKMIMLGHQVMGGFGFVEEVDLQLYYRRARAAETMFGGSAHYRECVAQAMGL